MTNLNEQWKQVAEFDGYMISNYGRVYSMKKKKLIKYGTRGSGCGYYQVGLTKDGKTYQKSIHRLVATHFIPNPENKKTVNHKDTNRKNNLVWNLEWSTQKENIQHAIDNGLCPHMEKKK